MRIIVDIMQSEAAVISREVSDHLLFLQHQGADPAKLKQLATLYGDALDLDRTLINEIGHACPAVEVESDGE